jgi:hypothetical protein
MRRHDLRLSFGQGVASATIVNRNAAPIYLKATLATNRPADLRTYELVVIAYPQPDARAGS